MKTSTPWLRPTQITVVIMLMFIGDAAAQSSQRIDYGRSGQFEKLYGDLAYHIDYRSESKEESGQMIIAACSVKDPSRSFKHLLEVRSGSAAAVAFTSVQLDARLRGGRLLIKIVSDAQPFTLQALIVADGAEELQCYYTDQSNFFVMRDEKSTRIVLGLDDELAENRTGSFDRKFLAAESRLSDFIHAMSGEE